MLGLNYFIAPLILLFVVPFVCAWIYSLIFRNILPNSIYRFFLGPVALLGCYVWAIPMQMGFYEFFRATF